MAHLCGVIQDASSVKDGRRIWSSALSVNSPELSVRILEKTLIMHYSLSRALSYWHIDALQKASRLCAIFIFFFFFGCGTYISFL